MDLINDPNMFQMMQNPIMPPMQQQPMQPMAPQPQGKAPVKMIDPRLLETPEITMETKDGSGFHFSVLDDDSTPNTTSMVVIDNTIPEEGKRRRGRPRKSEIIRPSEKKEALSGTVEPTPTAYTYLETTDMLRETLDQIDALNGELVQEFTNVKNNKYIKNKYNTMIGLSENIGSLLSNKISAIREINSSISKSNELDYKKMKDINALNSEVNDDQYVAEMYKSFISNPQIAQLQPQFTPIEQQSYGSGIIRADIKSGTPGEGPVEAGYLNYLSNISPEQNAMRYENDPNVQQVVVWDKRTNAKFFQVMNVATGEVIPNVPTYDQMFMEDTTIDVANKVAKNLNLRETFPLVIINDNVTSEY